MMVDGMMFVKHMNARMMLSWLIGTMSRKMLNNEIMQMNGMMIDNK